MNDKCDIVCPKTPVDDDDNKKMNYANKDDSLIEVEEDEPFLWTTKDDVWTGESLQHFLGIHPESAPKLLRIENEFYSNMWRHKAIAFYECVFEHPNTLEEKIVVLSTTCLIRNMDYKNILEDYKS